eukprot:8828992-Alexandrium_andersonii.AAC.1
MATGYYQWATRTSAEQCAVRARMWWLREYAIAKLDEHMGDQLEATEDWAPLFAYCSIQALMDHQG